MKLILCALTITAAICAKSSAQTPDAARLEFEVASIKATDPANRFHAAGSCTGGPGSADPVRLHCTCTLATLVAKAFELQRYQFPGELSLPGGTFDVSAKVPEGTTREQFLTMLQNLLKDRFGLAWHFDEKEMRGYELVVAKNGPKLNESKEAAAPSSPENGEPRRPGGGGDQHAGGHNGGSQQFGHSGLMIFNGRARYRADNQTIEELATALSNQIAKPVEDRTGLKGKYEISLNWSGDVARSNPEGAELHAGGAGHRDQPGSAAGAAASDDAPGPTLFDALQAQLGLKLVSAKKSTARIFIVDRVEKAPTAN